MKKSVTLGIESEKLTALEMYLDQKNMNLTEELEKYAEQLYQKSVPQNVRDFIEMTSSKKSSVKRRNTATAERGNQSEQ